MSGACGGGSGDDDVDAPGGADGSTIDTVAAPDAPPVCSAAATYSTVTATEGTFLADYDDNGGQPGDPIVGNDIQAVSGTLRAGPPLDLLYVNLYEGIGTFADKGGGVLDFDSFALPLVIDVGARPVKQDYDTCGACVSMLNDVTLDGGDVATYQVQLVAQSGTITISSMSTAAGETFTATLDDMEMAQIDINGDLVPGGCATTLTGLEISAVVAAP